MSAPYPFDHPQADLILRSSDKAPVDYRVFKLLLSLASPFFSVLLTLPQPPVLAIDVDDGPPIIQMSEDSMTLHALLTFCYPISTHPQPRLSSLAQLHAVAEAAVKYEMEGILAHIRSPHELLSPRFIESQPIRVFAISFLHNWVEEATIAARYTLRHPMPAASGYAEELERISAGAYHRLQEYHRMCGEVASARVLQERKALGQESDDSDEDSDGWVWFECTRCPSDTSLSGPRRWWTDWLKGVARHILLRPRGETVRNFDLTKKALAAADACSFCSVRAQEHLESFVQILSVQVEKEISKVELRIELVP